MSTLVTHHDGLDRVLRGVQVVVEGLYAGFRGPVGATSASANAAVQHPVGASAEPAPVAKPGVLARWIADRKRRRQEREFEALLMADPRMHNEFMAAKARSEWQA
ncbi:hypothetical protein M6I34_00005 [Burkholderiaceae bacterium FT117]|uniref:hypothetical protein n=1 Tax=Zeimonas sediminis TaxID=2944268 RepID=UPI002343023A|nr:hypothetical protein [Zeimonas sediminis]MCM5568884.1 hypothetical protein [Zeimonas sediminis]